MGNTVGSRGNLHWNTKEVREIRRKLELSEVQKAVLIGTILGDGCLSENADKKHWKKHWKKNFRLKIEQSDKHRKYVFWLHNIFKGWTLSSPKYLKERNAWRFYTLSHPKITEFRKIFYGNKRKIVPENIEKFLTDPLSLAVWFMDDGAGRQNCRVYSLCVHCFSKREVIFLKECLKRNFGLEIAIHWDGKGFRLYIPVRTAERFEDLIFPYIIPSMRYKFPLTP